MKLTEAIKLDRASRNADGPEWTVELSCGFTAFNFLAYFGANVNRRMPERRLVVIENIFGDAFGSIDRPEAAAAALTLVLIEWSDLDPRLGLRNASMLGVEDLDSVVDGAKRQATMLLSRIAQCAAKRPVVMVPPSLPFLPLFPTPPTMQSRWELELERIKADFVAEAARAGAMILADPTDGPPRAKRFSPRNELTFGFPYSLEYAEVLARDCVALCAPQVRKKALLLDLDNTLWQGIVGDDGVDGVHWGLDQGAHQHSALQKAAGFWATTGILLGVISKNEPEIAASALARADMLLRRERIHPVIASWNQKSAGVLEAARLWNIGTDAVVMIDDSEHELAEIAAVVPDASLVRFAPKDADNLMSVLLALRAEFGATQLFAEDALRAESVKVAGQVEAALADPANHESFLGGLDPQVVLATGSTVRRARAVELINKTNQFNLNGERVSDDTLATMLADGWSLVSVSYADRLSTLGDIAALIVRVDDAGTLHVRTWVMSCRAFSRRIEYQTLTALLDRWSAQQVRFDFAPTKRNAPIATLVRELLGSELPAGDDSADTIDSKTLRSRFPALYGNTTWAPEAA